MVLDPTLFQDLKLWRPEFQKKIWLKLPAAKIPENSRACCAHANKPANRSWPESEMFHAPCPACARLFNAAERTQRVAAADIAILHPIDFSSTTLRYHDDDGDCVTVACAQDLACAMDVFRSQECAINCVFLVFFGDDVVGCGRRRSQPGPAHVPASGIIIMHPQ